MDDSPSSVTFGTRLIVLKGKGVTEKVQEIIQDKQYHSHAASDFFSYSTKALFGDDLMPI